MGEHGGRFGKASKGWEWEDRSSGENVARLE